MDGAPKFLLIKVLDHLRVQNQSVNTRDLEVNPKLWWLEIPRSFWNRFEDDSESAVPLCSIAILRYLRSNIRNINWFNWFDGFQIPKRQHQALVGRGPLCKKTFCSGPASPRSTWNSVSQAGEMCKNHYEIQILSVGFYKKRCKCSTFPISIHLQVRQLGTSLKRLPISIFPKVGRDSLLWQETEPWCRSDVNKLFNNPCFQRSMTNMTPMRPVSKCFTFPGSHFQNVRLSHWARPGIAQRKAKSALTQGVRA